MDCVIHLAAVSNDPSAELNPNLTSEVNFEATVSLAEAARAKGIRFVFSSSCSVYGDAEGGLRERPDSILLRFTRFRRFSPRMP